MKTNYFTREFPILLMGISLFSCSDNENAGSKNKLDPEQPNILWISCEDITPTLGCYGDTVISTPNIDRLAAEGTRYTRAFSVAGVCAPSRHALITGMYPTATGGNNMRTTNIRLENLPAYGVVFSEEVRCFPEFLRREGYYCSNNRKTDYQFEAPITAWDECDYDAYWWKREEGQSFFSVINFITTHESRIWTQSGEPLLVDEASVPIPPYLPEHPKVRRDVARKYSNITEMDRQVGVILEKLEEQDLLDKTIIFFFSDHGGMLPREKRELYESGLRVPLIVRFPGKQDDGKVDDQLVSFVDFAPTVLSLAGIKAPEYMHGQAFLGKYKAQKEREFIFGGRDRMDEEYDRVRAARDKNFKYLKNYYPELPYVQNIVYRKQIPSMNVLYKYDSLHLFTGKDSLWWRKTKTKEELYDLRVDPYEFNNLAENPEYSEQLEKMRNAMENWQNTYGDMGGIPEQELVYDYMWKGKTQPVTKEVEFIIEDDSLSLNCPTPGASIAWKYSDQSDPDHWYLYNGPFSAEKGREIQARAIRIGYKHSTIKKTQL